MQVVGFFYKGDTLPKIQEQVALMAGPNAAEAIVAVGAELTWVYTKEFKHRLCPARGAVFLTEEMRIHQGIPHNETVEEAFKKRSA
jgi:hypothetical protein